MNTTAKLQKLNRISKQDQNRDKHRQYQIGRFEHKFGLGNWVRRNRGALTLFSLFTSVYSMQQQTAVVIDGNGGGDRGSGKVDNDLARAFDERPP